MPVARIAFFVALAALLHGCSAFSVFLCPHTHLDAGWTSTCEEYYQQKVKYIVDSLTDVLHCSRDKVFNWAEIGYLARWYEDADEARARKFKDLVACGKIQFAGAGWVQHDECVAHGRSAINQMTHGHRFLIDMFGPDHAPTYGWQIDPFGNAASTPVIFSLAGFTSTVTSRAGSLSSVIRRVENQHMEFFWLPQAPFDRPGVANETFLFAHELGVELYTFFGFVWEANDGGPGVPAVTARNQRAFRDFYAANVAGRRPQYRSSSQNGLMIPWGGDFLFYNKSQEWDNMDKVVAGFNDTQYSFIGDYFEQLLQRDSSYWPRYTGDFVPYSVPDTYWTGFYSSRAALKSAIRRYDALLENTDTFFALSLPNASKVTFREKIDHARNISGIFCHHDCVTGTSRQHVVQDYFDMAAFGMKLLQSALTESVSNILNGAPLTTEAPTSAGSRAVIVATTVDVDIVEFPVNVSVSSGSDGTTSCQISPFSGTWALAKAKAVSVQAHFLKPCEVSNATLVKPGLPFNVTNGIVTLQFGANQLLQSVNIRGQRRRLEFSYGRYWSMDGSSYFFRPDRAGIRSLYGNFVTWTSLGKLVVEVKQVLTRGDSEISHTFRLYANSDFVEIDYHIGVVAAGFDYVVRYQTDIENGAAFRTDAQGLFMVDRQFNSSMNLEASFYPATEMIQIRDSKTAFSVITSQSHGVSSQKPGEVELMLYRRLLNIGFPPAGMGEPLNDTAPLFERQRLVFTVPSDERTTSYHRVFLNNAPSVLFSRSSATRSSWKYAFSYSTSVPSFPLRVLTWKVRDDSLSSIMLRLQNLSEKQDIQADIVHDVFPGRISNSTEMALTFLSDWSSSQKRRGGLLRYIPTEKDDQASKVTIEAGMIRSYLVELK